MTDPSQAIALLQEQITSANDGAPSDFTRWRERSATALRVGLGRDHTLTKRFDKLRWTPMIFSVDTPNSTFDEAQRRGVMQGTAILESAVLELEMSHKADEARGSTPPPNDIMTQEQTWVADNLPLVQMAWRFYFRAIEWPSTEEAQRALDRLGHEIDVQLALSLMPKLPGELRVYRWSHVQLPLRLLRYLPEAHDVLAACFDVIVVAVELYYETDSQNLILPSDDSQLRARAPYRSNEDWYRAGILVMGSQPSVISGGGYGEGAWKLNVNGAVARRMKNLEDLNDFFSRSAGLLQEAQQIRGEPVLLLHPDPSSNTPSGTAAGQNQIKVFTLMPFNEGWSMGAFDFFRRAVNAMTLEPKAYIYRADDIEVPGRITDQITNAIDNADVVLADITDLNPNVMFELGYAFARGKRIVMVTQQIEEAPFDLQEWRLCKYSVSFTTEESGVLSRYLANVLGVPGE